MLSRKKIEKLLNSHNFEDLFISELGWDTKKISVPVRVDNKEYILKSVADKKGFTVLLCSSVPDSSTRLKIDTKASRSIREHLIIFADAKTKEQRWLWVRRIQGQPMSRMEHVYNPKQPTILIEKIHGMEIKIEEEENIDIYDVYEKVRSSLAVERVTKKFYDRFKYEHDSFRDFIDGIPLDEHRKWYTSVMLNRLMFIYFIQKQGFLDGDHDYLKNRLHAVQQTKGKDNFHTFYRYFLMKLCHEALGKTPSQRKLDKELIKLLGNVPYLNGGIFQPHELELTYNEINISDEAFEKIFAFFDEFDWHLDNRPDAAENEINPDVLGYIFEKYINQKQMGAYYTKEDITEYISKNTIIPSLFDKAKEKCHIAFEGDASIWNILRDDPDRYIYPPVRHGVTYDINNQVELKSPVPYPQEIAVGIDTSEPDLLERRKEWNKPAPPEAALPTEIWREVVARRQRYEEIKQKLIEGEIRSINDLITYNLDIRQFAQDVIESCESPDLLNAFWVAIAGRIPQNPSEEIKAGITILDPTCGSGAFLFAALNTLEPLYEACIERMKTFLNEWSEKNIANKHRNYSVFFKDILDDLGKHPTPKYYIYKSIIINNLFGVDIMKEAVEICKLRLFLKLVAQVQDSNKIEPLPDIDFNIRAGNTLVGFATLEDVRVAISPNADTGTLGLDIDMLPEIQNKAQECDRLYKLFRRAQLENDTSLPKAKTQLADKLKDLDSELNSYLAKDYGVELDKISKYKDFLNTHQPFHWFIEFYGIMKSGGFDVVIGNPPYVKYSDIKKEYQIKKYISEDCGNLYGFCIERSFSLMGKISKFGMIVPVSLISGNTYIRAYEIIASSAFWISSYSNRPGKLFQGVEQRLSIVIVDKGTKDKYTSNFYHWYEIERLHLLALVCYSKTIIQSHRKLPVKVGNSLFKSIFKKLNSQDKIIANYFGKSNHRFWYHDGPTYWIRCLPFEPTGNRSSRSSHYHDIKCKDVENSTALFCVISSSVFYAFFKSISNCRDLSINDIGVLPLNCEKLDCSQLSSWSTQLKNMLQTTSEKCSRKYPSGIIEYDEYYPAKCKNIIDGIDKILGKHYGFNEEELDYIINYDIKYRMGVELENDEK